MTTFKIGDIVNSINGSFKNVEIIDIYETQQIAVILYDNYHYNVYLKNLILIKHNPFYKVKRYFKSLKNFKRTIKNIIYKYNPLNYRIIHIDELD